MNTCTHIDPYVHTHIHMYIYIYIEILQTYIDSHMHT